MPTAGGTGGHEAPQSSRGVVGSILGSEDPAGGWTLRALGGLGSLARQPLGRRAAFLRLSGRWVLWRGLWGGGQGAARAVIALLSSGLAGAHVWGGRVRGGQPDPCPPWMGKDQSMREWWSGEGGLRKGYRSFQVLC